LFNKLTYFVQQTSLVCYLEAVQQTKKTKHPQSEAWSWKAIIYVKKRVVSLIRLLAHSLKRFH